MKVAIHNGWLVFDNQLGDYAHNVAMKHAHGRVRMDSIAQYLSGLDYVGASTPEPVTYVWSYGDGHAWRLNGNHQELLDGYFGAER